MGSYVPASPLEQQAMLAAIGCRSEDDLFAGIPADVRLQGDLAIPEGKSELEVRRILESFAAENTVFRTIFRGAGAYRHYIPAAVREITSKETFVTAYTPYQAEISQGLLQSIFEYQTMIAELTGLDASNASVYDGATAAAEAVAMCRERKRNTVYISAAAHPDVVETVKTYCFGSGTPVKLIPSKGGATDSEALKKMIAGDETAACVLLQQPNFYGVIEDAAAFSGIAHDSSARFIMSCNPVSLAILKAPAEYGADIAVGEGQPLGLPLGFGGPYLGFMACKQELLRKLPGRIVGETTDSADRRAFVLTLQAREQHIRREKATSNICSNEALCALTAAAYLSVMGPQGFSEVAEQCLSKAHYAAERIFAVPGFNQRFDRPFFHEFVTACPDVTKTLEALRAKGILGGLPVTVESADHTVTDSLLWCVTECNTKDEIDMLAGVLEEVSRDASDI